jgi:hypothetical protein
MLGAYALGGQAALGKIGEATQQALTPMETNLTNEQAKKAAAFGTNLQALRQQQFNNLVAQSGLNIKQQQITSTASTATANRQAANTRAANSLAQQKMESDRTYQLDKDKFGAAQAKDRYQKAHGLGPYAPPKSSSSAGSTGTAAKPMTPAQQRSVENQIARIQARFQWLYSHFQGIGANSSDAQQQALRAMTTGQIWAPPNPQSNNPAQRAWHWTYIQPEGDAQLRNIAFNSTNGNGLSAGDVAYLNRIGFTNRGLYPVAVQSPRTTPAPAGAGRTLR